MPTINVDLEVPNRILQGLLNGSLERVGGVIRAADSKQTVAWLRDSNIQKTNFTNDLVHTVPAKQILQASGAHASTAAALLHKALPIMNLSFFALSVWQMLSETETQRAELERLYERIRGEFDRDRLINLAAGLEQAKKLRRLKDKSTKQQKTVVVIDRLTEARLQLLKHCEELLDKIQPDESELPLQHHIIAMRITILMAHCWEEIGEYELAREDLNEDLERHKSSVRSYIQKCMVDPALYFHKSVSSNYFERFLNIERWLRGKRDVLPELVNEHRSSFWDSGAVSSIHEGFLNSKLAEIPFYRKAIPHAEILIENYRRLEGYEMELAAGRLSLPQEKPSATTENPSIDTFTMLIEPNVLSMLNRRARQD